MIYKQTILLPKDKIITYEQRGVEFPAPGETTFEMFPVLAVVLITGSVILMFLWEFQPLIKDKVFPAIIELLSVAEEKRTVSPIYLASSHIETEYQMLVKKANQIVLLGVPQIIDAPFKRLLSQADESVIFRLITASRSNAEQIKQMVTQLDRSVEIVHRPRIHFNVLATDQGLAVGSANFRSHDSQALHELTIICSDQSLVREARQYCAAFYEGGVDYPKNYQVYSLSSSLPGKTGSVFVNTSNGLNDLIHSLLSSAKSSVMLISPNITNDVAENILNIIPRDVQVKFITSVNWEQWVNEQSDPEALEILLSDRVVIDNCPNLYANCIIVDQQAAIISSQDLTTRSWFSKDEAGIFTRNHALINAILQRVESWQPRQRFSMELLEKEIAEFDSFLAKEPELLQPIPEEPKEDEVAPFDVSGLIAPPLLGFSTVTQSKPTIIPSTRQPESLIPSPIASEPKWLEDIVYVGTKRTVEYVRACQHQIKRKGSVTIRARGKLIYRAVDVAEQLRMLQELELILNEDSIKIETYYPTGKETKWGGISQIAITLHQKN